MKTDSTEETDRSTLSTPPKNDFVTNEEIHLIIPNETTPQLNTQITSFNAPIDREAFIDVLVNFLKLFISNAFLFLAFSLENLISFYFLSYQYNNLDILDAIGLADIYGGVLMFGFITFVIQVFNFQGPVSYGKKNYNQFGLQLHRTLIVSMFLWIALYIIHT